MSTWTPLVLTLPGSSRHLPVSGLNSVPSDREIHCCASWPSQLQRSTGFLLAAASPWLSRHLPAIWMVSSASTVHSCEPLLPLQAQMSTVLPSVVKPLRLSRQIPVGCVLGAVTPEMISPVEVGVG